MRCDRGWMGRPCGQWKVCYECGRRRAGDRAWCAREALRAGGVESVLLVTITAPGASVLPQDASGECEAGPLEAWCADMLHRWGKLNRTAQNRSRRGCPGSGGTPLVLVSAWQLQRRGAPHIHLVVSAGAPGQFYASALKELAPEYGFGFVDIATSAGHAVAAAHYVSNYLTRASSGVSSRFVKHLPSRVVYVNRTLQARSGATMPVARHLRRLWVYANVDREIGLPEFRDAVQRAWVYYWYRVGRHGLANVRRPLLAPLC